jgi:hypothetical protein
LIVILVTFYGDILAEEKPSSFVSNGDGTQVEAREECDIRLFVTQIQIVNVGARQVAVLTH